jgi:hypothetical protein
MAQMEVISEITLIGRQYGVSRVMEPTPFEGLSQRLESALVEASPSALCSLAAHFFGGRLLISVQIGFRFFFGMSCILS